MDSDVPCLIGRRGDGGDVTLGNSHCLHFYPRLFSAHSGDGVGPQVEINPEHSILGRLVQLVTVHLMEELLLVFFMV